MSNVNENSNYLTHSTLQNI